MKLQIRKSELGFAVLTDDEGTPLPGQIRTEIVSDGEGEIGGVMTVTFNLLDENIQFGSAKKAL